MNIINDTLETDCFYYIYNRGINGCQIFNSVENHCFFLNKFSKYLNDFVEVYSYCLMPNHFHFLIKVKSFQELKSSFNNSISNSNFNKGLHSESFIVSKQIAKFLSSYTQAYNKENNRHGALLESPFKRKKVNSEEYLKNLILYIHLNPIDIDRNYESYLFSSYTAIISNSKTNIAREEVINLFGDIDNFIYSHKHPPKFDFKF